MGLQRGSAQKTEISRQGKKFVFKIDESQLQDPTRPEKAVQRIITIHRERLDSFSIRDYVVAKESDTKIAVVVPTDVNMNTEKIKNILMDIGGIEIRKLNEAVRDSVENVTNNEKNDYRLMDCSEYIYGPLCREGNFVVSKKIYLTERDLKNVDVKEGEQNPNIKLQFTKSGTKKFVKLTENSIDEQIAVVYGKQILTVPFVQTAITGGTALIQSEFTKSEAYFLANMLRSHALPAPLNLISTSTLTYIPGKPATIYEK